MQTRRLALRLRGRLRRGGLRHGFADGGCGFGPDADGGYPEAVPAPRSTTAAAAMVPYRRMGTADGPCSLSRISWRASSSPTWERIKRHQRRDNLSDERDADQSAQELLRRIEQPGRQHRREQQIGQPPEEIKSRPPPPKRGTMVATMIVRSSQEWRRPKSKPRAREENAFRCSSTEITGGMSGKLQREETGGERQRHDAGSLDETTPAPRAPRSPPCRPKPGPPRSAPRGERWQ